ncbi:MAG TPA: phosphopantetheine-binding protein [Steroidobacteraceae bacterium]|nr:phosphopantetheine-binding protein [Steroidobacteraceae bacterium]
MSMTEAGREPVSPLTARERLLALVRKAMGAPGAGRPIAVDARLSELGISSIKMVGLMLAIEAEFDLTIAQSEITPENFASIASMESMLDRILGH